MNLHETVGRALREIASRPKGSVYASRKGIVAACNLSPCVCYTFRREQGRIRFERWHWDNGASATLESEVLPPDLEARAAAMLDNL